MSIICQLFVIPIFWQLLSFSGTLPNSNGVSRRIPFADTGLAPFSNRYRLRRISSKDGRRDSAPMLLSLAYSPQNEDVDGEEDA